MNRGSERVWNKLELEAWDSGFAENEEWERGGRDSPSLAQAFIFKVTARDTGLTITLHITQLNLYLRRMQVRGRIGRSLGGHQMTGAVEVEEGKWRVGRRVTKCWGWNWRHVMMYGGKWEEVIEKEAVKLREERRDKEGSCSKRKRGYTGGSRQIIEEKEEEERGYRGDVRNINRGSGLPAGAHSAPNTYCHSD